MTSRFDPAEWVRVVPPERHGMFATPYAEPASIVAQETGSDVVKCGAMNADQCPSVRASIDADLKD